MKGRISRRWLYIFGSLVLLAALVGGIARYKRKIEPQKPYNILILSICSLRWDFLAGWEKTEIGIPKRLQEFADNSFQLTQAITDVPWSNASGFLTDMSPAIYAQHGYEAVGEAWPAFIRYWQQIPTQTPLYYLRMPHVILDADIQKLAARVNDAGSRPFFLMAHFKFMHLPYSKLSTEFFRDKNALALPNWNFLDGAEKASLREYFLRPWAYPERLPLFLLLGKRADVTQLLKSLGMKYSQQKNWSNSRFGGEEEAEITTYVGLLNDPRITNRWKRSPHFAADLRIVQKIYRARLLALDKMLGAFFDSANPGLWDNTVVMLMGDHGESLGEHGHLAHSGQVYDETLRFPLLVRFPGMQSGKMLSQQFYQGTIRELVESLMAGRVNADNFPDFVSRHSSDYIFSQNCDANIFSVRYQGKWKLILNEQSGERELYNLKEDPGEMKNVFAQEPDMAARLEEVWLRDAKSQAANRMAGSCRKVP